VTRDNIIIIIIIYGMVRPGVADGDGPKIWTEQADLLNNLSKTADKGYPIAWGLVEELKTTHRKN
jgi:hypothetical protein